MELLSMEGIIAILGSFSTIAQFHSRGDSFFRTLFLGIAGFFGIPLLNLAIIGVFYCVIWTVS